MSKYQAPSPAEIRRIVKETTRKIEPIDEDLDDDNEIYQLTPKGIALLSLLQCGLITDMDDPRAEGFWILFESGMRKNDYIKEEEDED